MGTGIATEDRRAEGEAEVTRALRRLPEGWIALHELPWPGRTGSTIDHVVVGPGGVFVIRVESWTGTIEVRDEVLTQDGRSREQTVDLAARAAIAVQGIVPARCFPVICFAGAPLACSARGVMISSSPTVRLQLVSRPHRLGPDDVRRCVEALQAASGHRGLAAMPARAVSGPQGAGRKQRVSPVRAVNGVLGLLLAFLMLVLGGGLQQAADWVRDGDAGVTNLQDEPAIAPVTHQRDR